MSKEKFDELKSRLQTIHDIESAAALLIWDQNTFMPGGGALARGEQLATLKSVAHGRWMDPVLPRLVDQTQVYADACGRDSFEAAFLRVVRRELERSLRVPQDFVERFSRHTSDTYNHWHQARKDDDFKRMIPFLEKTVELSRERAGYANGFEHPADVLIDLADEGMTVKKLKPLFAELREGLLSIIDSLEEKPPADDTCLKGKFPEEVQEKFGRMVVEKIGYDFSRGRLDRTHHPFCIKFANGDVRITTRYREDDLSGSLFSTIHEAGHAMYEQGVAAELEGTLLAHGTSAGVHESQSRLWENLVGRSLSFWHHFYPELQSHFPDFKKVDLDTFYRAINKVERGLIRTDADEVTYNLHVMIRFDLECELLEGKLAVSDLAHAWKARYQSDLGILPPCDRDGVLQDVHWYTDYIGGQFQCYALGNVMAAQFYAAARQALPGLENEIIAGKFNGLREWLVKNIYSHGAKFSADETLTRATGASLKIQPYLAYLRAKYL